MTKNDLKSLVAQMYKELLVNIDAQETVNKEQVIDYLEDAICNLKKIDIETDSIEHAKLAFTNAYKDIAKKSISSYKETNGKFEELGKLHKSTSGTRAFSLNSIPLIISPR